MTDSANVPPDPVTEARVAVDRNYLNLGRELYVAFETGRYREKFETFESYAASKGVDPWRAKRLRRVFQLFSKDLGVSFQRLEQLGYERAIAIMPVITSANKEEWLGKAETMDYVALVNEVKAKKPPGKRRVVKSATGEVKQTYSPENPQKLIDSIKDARLKPSTDGQTDANDDVVYEKTLYLIGDQNKVFEAALECVERKTGSTKVGYLLTCALLEFLAHSATHGSSDDERMQYFMGVLERRYGGKLLWMQDKKAAAEAAAALKEATDRIAAAKEAKVDAAVAQE